MDPPLIGPRRAVGLPVGLRGEQLFATLLRSSGEGLVLSRADGTLVEVSDAFVELSGYSRDELLGRTAMDLGLITVEAHRRMLRALDTRDSMRRFEADLRTRDGELRRVEFSTDVLRAGVDSYLLTTLRDVTERQRSEAALRAAEARYRELFESAATGIAHVRADGTLLEVNRAWAGVLGYESPEQYVAEVVSARNIYEDAAQREEFLAELRARGTVTGFEARLRHRNGGRVWVALDARAVTDDTGEVVDIHAGGLDITERKLAEQALRESEARFRSIFVHGLDGILVLAEDGSILTANPAACAMLRGTEDDLRRLGYDALIDTADAGTALALRSSARFPAHAEIRMRRADGSSFPAEVTSSSFEDADGERNTSVIVRDVSERRRIDDELRRAKYEAETANRAKSEFLSRMSHELRTPLNAILGFAQLLEMDLPPERSEDVRQILRAGRHLLALINEVLDISRIETGQLTLSSEPVRLTDLVDEAVGLVRPLARPRRISIEVVAPPGHDCYAFADRQRSKQVLLNLLSNAIKYNRDGGSVTVTCVVESPMDRSSVAVEVSDTGIGIPAADLQRLFIPFERLGAAATDVEGTGIGLALSQRLARAMGGDIAVSSRVGHGSMFRLILPAGSPPEPVEEPAPALPAATSSAPPHSRTVLSIEDNLANTRLLEQIIARRPGWRVRTAGQGQLGLDLALADPPDLVLLDLHLPDLHGTQVLRRLKADPATQAIPVAIVSADATPNQIDRLRASGADAYFAKPIEVTEVLAYLDQISARMKE